MKLTRLMLALALALVTTMSVGVGSEVSAAPCDKILGC